MKNIWFHPISFNIVILLFLMLSVFHTNTAAQYSAESLARLQQKNIDEALNSDGTIKKGISGSFDARGYELGYGINGEPVLKKYLRNESTNSSAMWSSVGSGRNGVGGSVNAISVAPSGDIYVGGQFTTAGDIFVKYIAKWNPVTNSWSRLQCGTSDGVNGTVSAIAVSGDMVFVGGQFTALGNGTPAGHIAIWNSSGGNWSTLASGTSNGVNGNVNAIALCGNDLYIGGNFTALNDGTAANYVASWNLSTGSWSPLLSGTSNGVSAQVNALAVKDNNIFIGGKFTFLGNGTTSANRIAIWNNSAHTWSVLPYGTSNGVNNDVSSIAVTGDYVYFGGSFTFLGDNSTFAKRIARWNTLSGSWSILPAELSDGTGGNILALAASGNDIYAGGYFTSLGNGSAANRIAKWNSASNSWSALVGSAVNGLYSSVNAIASSGSNIYIGGDFTVLGDGITPVRNIAKWNGGWSQIGGGNNGLPGPVNAISVSGSNVFMGGQFNYLSDFATSANNIVKWNGSSWSVVPCGSSNGVKGTVYSIAVNGNDVYVGGNFILFGDETSANRIAKWNSITNSWSALPCGSSNGVNGTVYAIAISGNDIYAGGSFTALGDNTPAGGIAKWDAAAGSWSVLPCETSNGVSGTVYALCQSGDYIYAGGSFSTLGNGTIVQNIARWNTVSNTWSALAGGGNRGVSGPVYAIAADDNNIFAGGSFDNLVNSSTSARNIARWNLSANSWYPLGSGINNGVSQTVKALVVCNGDLYVGGQFPALGDGTPAMNLAKWNIASGTWDVLADGGIAGLNGSIYALAFSLSEQKIYTGGSFINVGNNNVAFNTARFTDSNNPLPVELTLFNVCMNNNSAILNWQTATEVNNFGFEIERSYRQFSATNNTEFLRIGFVSGNGSSSSEKEYTYTDNLLAAPGIYTYRLKQLDNNGSFEYSAEVSVPFGGMPFILGQNYPNPFNPATVISYQIDKNSLVSIRIFNSLGEEVKTVVNEFQTAGRYTLEFNASSLPSGVYYYMLQAGGQKAVRKMIYLK